jgi:hypothetical protein
MEKSKRAYWDAVEANEGKIDPEKYGIGMTGMNGSPSASINGKELYRRIFIRLRTPQEVLTCTPIENSSDFARRTAIIESWFDSVIRKGNYILTFSAEQVSDEEAAALLDAE